MATTNFGWTTPALGSANNVPSDLASLATQIDTTMAPYVTNTVRIGGVDYARSGGWATETLGAPDATYSPSIYVWTLTKTMPYTPPAGYTFAVSCVSSNGYTVASYAGGGVRVITIANSSPTIRLVWQLVKI